MLMPREDFLEEEAYGLGLQEEEFHGAPGDKRPRKDSPGRGLDEERDALPLSAKVLPACVCACTQSR